MSGKNTLSTLDFPDERKNLSEGVRWIISEMERINDDNKKRLDYSSILLIRAVTTLASNIIALTNEELVTFGKRVENTQENARDSLLAQLLIEFSNMKDENEGKKILLEDDLLKSPFPIQSKP